MKFILIWLFLHSTCLLQAEGNTNILTVTSRANTCRTFNSYEGRQTAPQQTLFTCNDIFNALRQLKEIASNKPELKNPELLESGARIAKFSFVGEEAQVFSSSGSKPSIFVGLILSKDQTKEKTEELFKQYKQILIQCKPSNWNEYEDREVSYGISHYSSGEVSIDNSGTMIGIGFKYYLLYNKTDDEVPITCPHLLRVFDAIKDGSIRGAQTVSAYDRSFIGYNTSINFEKQVESEVTVFYHKNDSSYRAKFVLLNSRSEEESQQKFMEIKQQVKNCVPPDWFVKDYNSGSGPEAEYVYHLSEKEDRSSGKYIRVEKTYYEHSYTVTLQFEYKK